MGFAPIRATNKSQKKIQLLYSGPMRDSYLTVPAPSAEYSRLLATNITVGDLQKMQAKYIDSATVGALYAVANEKSLVEKNLTFTALKNSSRQTLGYVLTAKNSNPCAGETPAGHEKIFQFVYENSAKNLGWNAQAYLVEKDHSLKKLWQYNTKIPSDLVRTNSIVIVSPEKSDALFAVVTKRNEIETGPSVSNLEFIHADTGEHIDSIPFPSTPYFSMPLVVDEKIIIATHDKQFVMLTKSNLPWKIFYKHTLFYKLIKKWFNNYKK